MKRTVVISAAVVLLVLLLAISAFVVVTSTPLNQNLDQNPKPFYVGVTYCGQASYQGGNATSEAKLLIDRVKNYTNLFVLQSGSVQMDLHETQTICDYAVANGLDVIIYLSSWDSSPYRFQSLIDLGKQSWGSHFLGVYYGDEPGGKLLDASSVSLRDGGMGENVTRELPIINGLPQSVIFSKSDGTEIRYDHPFANFSYVILKYANGTSVSFNSGILPSGNGSLVTKGIRCTIPNASIDPRLNVYPNGTVIETSYTYLPNGTILKSYIACNQTEHGNITFATNTTIVSKEEAPTVGTYEEALTMLPFRSYDETAARLIDHLQTTTQWLRDQSTPSFTSDYALHWFDYQGGYDVVLTQVGGNRSVAQDIALGRGAATAQNKEWGTILCWKSDIEPYLSGGDEMYSQMRASYEAGAKYVVFFNYPALAGNLYGGAIQEEHFQALERFWNDCVQNPQVSRSANQAEVALVLPHDYGWGLRRQNDTIWGFWQPDDKAPAVWSSLQNALSIHGTRLDIAFDDPAYPVADKYPQIIYWNQTEPATLNSQAPG